jgi:hypothetical protein
MKRQVLSLSVAAAIAMAGVIPASYAEDEVECDGILVQSRFALANCMVESIVAIAAAAASTNGCAAGEWSISAIVPEWYRATLPIQGLAYVTNGDGDEYELNSQSSAMLQNNVNCQVNTTDDVNTFDGQDLNYSSGSGNYYPDAVIDKDEYMLCISSSLSAGNISLGQQDFEEADALVFEDEDDEIEAEGTLSILYRTGSGQKSQEEISLWEMDEDVVIPELGTMLEDAIEYEAVTDDIGECKITIKGSVENLESNVPDEEVGGLTIVGTLSVGPDTEEEDD